MSELNRKDVKTKLSDLFSVMSEKLEAGGSVTFSPQGTSMLPLIRPGIDSITLVSPRSDLKKHDVVFYKRRNGQFVLHRIEKIRGNDLVIRGDNQLVKEYGITKKEIIGVMESFSRGNKNISCQSFGYRLYVMTLMHLHRLKLRIKIFVKKVLYS